MTCSAKARAFWTHRPQRGTLPLLHILLANDTGKRCWRLGCRVDRGGLPHGHQVPHLDFGWDLCDPRKALRNSITTGIVLPNIHLEIIIGHAKCIQTTVVVFDSSAMPFLCPSQDVGQEWAGDRYVVHICIFTYTGVDLIKCPCRDC